MMKHFLAGWWELPVPLDIRVWVRTQIPPPFPLFGRRAFCIWTAIFLQNLLLGPYAALWPSLEGSEVSTDLGIELTWV